MRTIWVRPEYIFWGAAGVLTVTGIVVAVQDWWKYRKRVKPEKPLREETEHAVIYHAKEHRRHPSCAETEELEKKYIRDTNGDLFENLIVEKYETVDLDDRCPQIEEDYQSMAEQYQGTDDDDEETGIQFISESQFNDTKPLFEKISLTYYIFDDVLLDDQNEIITDTKFVIGVPMLDAWWKAHGDPDQIWVRNFNSFTDYEVSRVKGSYLQIQDLEGLEY